MVGIKLVNVGKVYTVEKEKMKVLDGINLDIHENKITVILGRSGCGKTTLLRLVAGLEELDQGEIQAANIKKKAYVFQEDRLMPWLNVKKNITFGIKDKNISEEKINEIINHVVQDHKFKVDPGRVVLYGLCEECQKNKQEDYIHEVQN